MLFQYKYEDEEYLINLEPFEKDANIKEVFRIIHGDNEEDWEEYGIKIFLVDGESLILQKATEFPEQFQQMLGEDIERVMPVTFVANPFFDEVMIFYGNTIFTSKDRYKPIACDQCEKKELYEKKEKGNKSDYIEDVQSKLKANPNPDWPFKDNLLIQFAVSDKQSRLNEVDLDNLAKSIFDSIKGVVFVDDAQIIGFAADKECVKGINAHIIAIKRLAPGERAKYQEFLFSGRINAWQKEYEQKKTLNKFTRFTRY